MTQTIVIRVTPRELEAITAALVDREERLVCGDSSDEAHHGAAWADEEITRVRNLITRISA